VWAIAPLLVTTVSVQYCVPPPFGLGVPAAKGVAASRRRWQRAHRYAGGNGFARGAYRAALRIKRERVRWWEVPL
jgi:hypothetical protein